MTSRRALPPSQGRCSFAVVTYADYPTHYFCAIDTVSFAVLSTATVKRNADLENRVAELERELLVWKQAHAAVVESADREKKTHNAQVSTLNRQISSLETLKVRTTQCVLTRRVLINSARRTKTRLSSA